MKVYILIEEVDIIGVYRSRELALRDARALDLHNCYIEEKELI